MRIPNYYTIIRRRAENNRRTGDINPWIRVKYFNKYLYRRLSAINRV